MKKFKSAIKKEGRLVAGRIKKQSHDLLKTLEKTKQIIKHLELIILGLFLLIFFLGFELILRIHDLYRIAYWVDVPSHFFAGIAIASLVLMLLHLTKVKYKKTISTITVFVLAILWEALETIGDAIIPQPAYMLDFFIWDGMWDIVVTTVGGITFLVIFNRYIRGKLGIALNSLKR